MLSVFLGNEEIYAVLADVKNGEVIVKSTAGAKLTSGCILNGVITNEDALSCDIERFWKENNLPKKSVWLVINSKQLTMKKFAIPEVNSKKAIELVKMEFSDSEKNDPVFDYMPLSEGAKGFRQTEVLGVVCEAGFIESYVNIFKNRGIRLYGITDSVISIIKLIYCGKSSLKNQTAIIQTLDGNNLLSFIIKDGEYIYSQRTRLFSSRNTADFITEIVNSISRLRQFHISTQKSDINRVYFDGTIDGDTLNKMNDVLGIYEISAEYLPDFENIAFGCEGSVNRFIFAMGSTFNANKDINLFKEYKVGLKHKSKISSMQKNILVGAGVLCASVLLLSGFYSVRCMMLKSKINKINEYLSSPQNANAVAMAEEISAENDGLKAKKNALSRSIEAIKTYPVYNGYVRGLIMGCEDDKTEIEINKIDLENGIIRLEAMCAGTEAAGSIAERLEATGLFLPPDYHGKTLDAETGKFIVSIECILKERSELLGEG